MGFAVREKKAAKVIMGIYFCINTAIFVISIIMAVWAHQIVNLTATNVQ